MLDVGDIIGPISLKVRLLVLGVLLAALAALVVLYGEWRADAARSAERNTWQQAIDRQKKDAALLLSEETGKVLLLERELTTARTRIEEVTRERETITRGYEARLAAAAARNNGRLRDPNAKGCGGGGGGAPAQAAAPAGQGAGDPAEASGLLSVQLSDLLRARLREADDINDAYAECRADAVNLRNQLSPP